MKPVEALQLADGYDTYTDESETGTSTAIYLAPYVKFGNDYRYTLRDGVAELPRDTKEFIAGDVRRYIVKWSPDRNQPPERYPLDAGAPWPDLELRNENTPRSEWTIGPDGAPKGPWSAERQVLLLDAETMAPYLFVTQTGGGHKAVSDLAHQTKNMRQACGQHVCPVITLSTTLWSKRFNRLRPNFPVKRFIEFGGAQSARLTGPTVREVERPAPREELKDEVKF